MSDKIVKRCECGKANWTKCADPWFMKNYIRKGVNHRHNINRWAAVHMDGELKLVETKKQAAAVCEIMRTRIFDGSFRTVEQGRLETAAKQDQADRELMTLDQLVAVFDKDVLSNAGRLEDDNDDDETSEATIAGNRARLRKFCAFNGYGARAAKSIDAQAILDFKTAEMRKLSRSSWAKYRGMIDRLFTEAHRLGVVTINPFEAASKEQARKLRRRKAKARTRRLLPGEYERLQAAALQGRRRFDAQRLHDLIVAAHECAGRQGEIMALQWRDVIDTTAPHAFGTPPVIGKITQIVAVEDGAAKTGEPRAVPTSKRLRQLYASRQISPITGQPYPLDAYVFGDVTGARTIFPRNGWISTVVRSSGQPYTQERGNISPESRTVYMAVDLHFHDIRRECASRWLELKTFDILEIMRLLGHNSIATTQIYLGIKPGSTGAVDAMAKHDAERERLEQEAAELAKASGGETDHNPITSGHDPAIRVLKPRLVKGRNSGGDR